MTGFLKTMGQRAQQMSLPVRYSSLTPAQRQEVRRVYAHRQAGLCWHCKAPLDQEPPAAISAKTLNMKLFPPGFLDWPVHLHHDKKTGLTVGATHAYCNGVLFQYHGQ